MIETWADFVQPEYIDRLPDAVFSTADKAAMKKFQAVWDQVCTELSRDLPALHELFGTEPWENLRTGAMECLTALEAQQ
jgi:hypothetical protein